MLVAMGCNTALLVKLADRLHDMRTLGALPAAKRNRLARETIDVWAPLANRLGVWSLKAQLEDLAFKQLYPTQVGMGGGPVTLSAPSAHDAVGRPGATREAGPPQGLERRCRPQGCAVRPRPTCQPLYHRPAGFSKAPPPRSAPPALPQYAELRRRLEQVQSADVLVSLMDRMRAEMQRQDIRWGPGARPPPRARRRGGTPMAFCPGSQLVGLGLRMQRTGVLVAGGPLAVPAGPGPWLRRPMLHALPWPGTRCLLQLP